MKLETLFPVQKQVIPILLNSNLNQSIYPNDVCVTAPTGSGKTLTYVLPIIQNLKNRVRPCCRAIVLLPVSDLAEQVYSVFKAQLLNDSNNLVLNEYVTRNNTNKKTTTSNSDERNLIDLKCILLSNKHSFTKEQAQLINANNGKCEMDIVITTPGRLVDHILKTKGFCLKELQYLVLDECDRIMDQIKQNWLQILNNAVFSSSSPSSSSSFSSNDEREEESTTFERETMTSELLNVNNLVREKRRLIPYQKILLSATLTRDPEKFEQIKLFQPIFFNIGQEKQTISKSVAAITDEEMPSQESIDNDDNDNDKKKTKKPEKKSAKLNNNEKNNSAAALNMNLPNELNEVFIQVLSLQKPLMLIYLIKKLGYRRMLCFVKSKESARRLNKLLELNGGIRSMEYSTSLHLTKRKQIQMRFENDELDVLVCSDVMARGMDLANVDYVLLYDSPFHLSSYVHKVGRTARAGRSGTAITFLEHKEIFHFKKMMQSLNTSDKLINDTENTDAGVQQPQRHKVKEIKIQSSKLKPYVEDYEHSLEKLKELIKSKSFQ